VIRKEIPEDIPEVHPTPEEGSRISLPELLTQTGLVSSKSEARRLIKQKAVSIEGEKVTDPHAVLDLRQAPFVVRVGKRRFARIVWDSEEVASS